GASIHCQPEGGHWGPIGRVAQLGIACEIAEQDDFVEVCHTPGLCSELRLFILVVQRLIICHRDSSLKGAGSAVAAPLLHSTTAWIAPVPAHMERLATSSTPTAVLTVLVAAFIVRDTRETGELFLFVKPHREIAQDTLTQAVHPFHVGERFRGRAKMDEIVIAIALLLYHVPQTALAPPINANDLSPFAFQELDRTLDVGLNVFFRQLRMQDKDRFIDILPRVHQDSFWLIARDSEQGERPTRRLTHLQGLSRRL